MTNLNSTLSFNLTLKEYSPLSQRREDIKLTPKVNVQVRELKEDVSLEQAVAATTNNGYDEVFFSSEGKRFVAFTTDPSLLEVMQGGQKNQTLTNLQIDGKAVELLKLNDEASTFLSGAWDTTKSIGEAVIVKPYQLLKPVLPNAATAGTFLGGVALGAATRLGDLQTTTRIGLTIGAAGGVGTVRAMTDKGSETARTLKGAATGLASVAIGALAPEAAKLIAKIPIPDLVSKSFQVAGTAALVGGSIAIVGGGVAAATRSAQPESFDAIAK